MLCCGDAEIIQGIFSAAQKYIKNFLLLQIEENILQEQGRGWALNKKGVPIYRDALFSISNFSSAQPAPVSQLPAQAAALAEEWTGRSHEFLLPVLKTSL